MVRVVLALLAAALAVVFAPTASAQTLTDLGGGMRINNTGNSDGYCTLAAVGEDDLGNLVALTAGHCMKAPGDPLYLYGQPETGPLGHWVTYNVAWWTDYSTNGDKFPFDSSVDYSVILLDRSKVNPVSTTPNGLSIDTIGPRPRQLFDVVCKDGQTTNVTCGRLIEPYTTDDNTIRTWQYVWFGDSGGPLVLGDGLVGIVSAINPIRLTGPFQFTGIHGVLDDIASQGPTTVGIGFEPF